MVGLYFCPRDGRSLLTADNTPSLLRGADFRCGLGRAYAQSSAAIRTSTFAPSGGPVVEALSGARRLRLCEEPNFSPEMLSTTSNTAVNSSGLISWSRPRRFLRALQMDLAS